MIMSDNINNNETPKTNEELSEYTHNELRLFTNKEIESEVIE